MMELTDEEILAKKAEKAEKAERSRKLALEKQLKELRPVRERVQRFRQVSLLFTLVVLAVTPLLVGFLWNQDTGLSDLSLIFILTPLSYALMGLATFVFARNRERDLVTAIQEILGELDLLSISESSLQQRSEKLFKLHQLELKKYYDQTLSHSSLIFAVGIICLLLGFVIIGGTIYAFVFASGSFQGITEKIALAALGAVGGLLSNFIAAIYLKMHSDTIKSLTEFHNRLVLTHHLFFGNFLAAKIEDTHLREHTFAQIAAAIANVTPEKVQDAQPQE